MLLRYCTTRFATLRWLIQGTIFCLLSCLITKDISDQVLYKKYINLLISYWYILSLTSLELSSYISLKLPTSISVLTGLQSRIPSSLMKLWMKTDWSIFNIDYLWFCVTCYLIIVFISLRSLTLYISFSFCLIQSRDFYCFTVNKKSSIYTLTIVIFLFSPFLS